MLETGLLYSLGLSFSTITKWDKKLKRLGSTALFTNMQLSIGVTFIK